MKAFRLVVSKKFGFDPFKNRSRASKHQKRLHSSDHNRESINHAEGSNPKHFVTVSGSRSPITGPAPRAASTIIYCDYWTRETWHAADKRMRTVFSAAALLAVLAVAQAEVPSVCGMCKEHVSNFVEASHNPIKLAELRATLLHVCAGTSFATDCSLVAGKLDFIARRLAPYMADTEAVCTKFQACPEPDLAGLPQLVVLFLKQSEGRMTFDAAKVNSGKNHQKM
ncbi:unnamed protein product [Caenorhabditis auriculariae]|uniref:Saposin B-type domain-containing protein n=1 Tax=Caenorhabditis auriculariae TaxID=2777116 RepID=A0A8S1HKD2_9PELO|nr:unnamed protein product [Caenorhabditis auriculariae]